MKTHAAFPDGKYFERMGCEVGRFIKQNLPQSPADDYPQHSVEQQVVELFGGNKTRVRLDAQSSEPDKLSKGGEIHQAIPVYRERANG